MLKTKANRLQKLSEVVRVPVFFAEKNAGNFSEKLDNRKKYIVRSSSRTEDQKGHSHAGQFLTVGPVSPDGVRDALEEVLGCDGCEEAIVQEFVEEKEKGVAFCFSDKNIFVEYSAVPEGVTSGKVKPFVAVFPTNIKKYGNLLDEIAKVYQEFGSSDIEFIGIENPCFVQVRPITKEFKYDKNLETLKMHLQQLGSDHWVENDFCRIIPEWKGKEKSFIKEYFKSVKNVFEKYFKKNIDIPSKTIIKISDQYFMPKHLEDAITPGKWDILKISFKFPNFFEEIKSDFDKENSNILELMENSLLLSYFYGVSKKKEVFDWREKYKKKIYSMLSDGEMNLDFISSDKLQPEIKFNPKKATWEKMGYFNQKAIIIVDGNFESGPFFEMKNANQEIPKGVVVVTRELYPKIGKYMRKIKGIICKNGSFSSHISILAREYNIPLKIQDSEIE